jgi:Glycosyl transferase family 2
LKPVQIVIPVGPYHKGLAGDAIASAKAQTFPCEVVVIEDTQGRGAGWARNQGWRQGMDRSPFTVFLDADDVLAPAFVERTLAHYQPPHYVYSDWQTEGGEIIRPPDRTDLSGWYEGRVFHTVSVLIPTALLQSVGGFDESLTAMEETDLFLRLRRFGVCGVRCPEVLMTYHTRRGQRAKNARETGEDARMREWLHSQYGDTMACGCAGGAKGQAAIQSEKQAGDVLALSLWSGNHSVAGQFSARRYRGGNGKRVWVHPEDARLDPDHWQVMFNPTDITPSVDDVLAMSQQAMQR